MSGQVITTVPVELTRQEISVLLSALITAPAGIADQLIVRLAHAYHQSIYESSAVSSNEPEIAEHRAITGSVSMAEYIYGEVVLSSAR